ncbi:MAG: 5-amino-6-(D-ribitylamino)uracil--L-tyrosine 4-hydroxyphenyl transferase CofH [Candidatus Eremiobacteraeota bacterium]|nr:5-amino-6-(D-ribitylamino)uracil--L-tyrosine 4-hydroxyphenyl transferase CofH [Candidatus Eremiobacteraeota bacterium]MCW5867412.1 5-amino-6-(D-ribitylamino)uracil--L-tyrosine 4-hydroxyphenyl transferase CofH [Candidatus Eremiobacteraeota bacterium]
MLQRSRISEPVYQALASALEGATLTYEEALPLTRVIGPELLAMQQVADELRQRQVGERVTYVVNRNINFTNVCIKHCGFCAFSRDFRTEEGYHLSDEEILGRVQQAVDFGATEVCIQAGLPPKMEGDLYIQLTRKIKAQFPSLLMHAFSPEEVLYGAVRSRCSIQEYLQELKTAGLDSLPGTSAELLVPGLRDQVAPGRISVEQWTEVIRGAHGLGLPTTSTMMYGFVEEPEHWLQHMLLLRNLQEETGGFTEFVPLGFVHSEAPMYLRKNPGVRAGASGVEVLRVHALARVFLGTKIPNLQVSWVKEGLKLAQGLLMSGVNDLGGTLMNESISTAAGSGHGQRTSPATLHRLIEEVGRQPAQRNTKYEILREFSPGEAPDSPLDRLGEENPFGSYQQLVKSQEHRYRRAAVR